MARHQRASLKDIAQQIGQGGEMTGLESESRQRVEHSRRHLWRQCLGNLGILDAVAELVEALFCVVFRLLRQGQGLFCLLHSPIGRRLTVLPQWFGP